MLSFRNDIALAGHTRELLLVSLLVFLSCGQDTGEPAQITENSIPEYQLAVVDSFGVEVGDSFNMLGSVEDFCHSADGSIFILDHISQNVRIVSEEGNAGILCHKGSGPGELLYPLALCALENGHFLVSDEGKQEIMEYDLKGEYLGSFVFTGGYVPYSMYPINSDTIIADLNLFDMEPDIPRYVHLVGGFNSGSSDPFQVFNEMSWDWTSAEFYSDIGLLDFTADTSGRIFIASDNTKYEITVFTLDGSEVAEINGQIERIRKTDEQIQLEIEEFEEWAVQDQAYMGGFQPPGYHQLISLAGIDADGNLWVQRHDSTGAVKFDVWDETYNRIFTVSNSGNDGTPELEFHIDTRGILAANTESEVYPRVYSFELMN